MTLVDEMEAKKRIGAKVRIIISILAVVAVVIVLLVYFLYHKSVLHGTYWGMNVSTVEKLEYLHSGSKLVYNEVDKCYVASDTDFFGEDASLLYFFEENQLSGIIVEITSGTYESAYNIAYNICKEYNLPVEFKDSTDSKGLKTSLLTWKIKGATIKLFCYYKDKDTYTYKYWLEPSQSRQYGDKYEGKGECMIESVIPSVDCHNDSSPWSLGNFCYEHGCCVIGCPNMISSQHTPEVPICEEHYFLTE